MRGARVDVRKSLEVLGFVAATDITFGIGAGTARSAFATDNIKTFGEQERLNGPNGMAYIGYTVDKFGPSKDPVPHNGTLYAANLMIDGFGADTNPMIERFGARAQNGVLYPAIMGASTMGKLYFDVVGDVPNSVVWNDGVRDILAWIPGKLPLEPKKTPPAPAPVAPAPRAPEPASAPAVGTPAAMPSESDPAIVATPNDLAAPPYQLTPGEVAQPGFNR